MTRPWLIVGCGGHGREVADVLKARGERLLGFLDDNSDLKGTYIGGHVVLGGLDWLISTNIHASIGLGIGNGKTRKQIVDKIKNLTNTVDFPTIIHPNTSIGSRVEIGEGTLIQAGCTLTCDIKIGAFVLLNTGVGLSHDVKIGDFASIAPKCQFTGATTCGAYAEIGTGTLVIPKCNIGENATLGAGAVVIRDIPAGMTAVGVPAQPKKNRLL